MMARKVRRSVIVVTAVFLALVCLFSGAPPAAVAEDAEAVVTARRLFLRRGPGTEFPPYTTIGEGSTVTVKELHGKWARVSTLSGQTGYVHGDFLRFLDKVPAPAAAAEAEPEVAEPTVQSDVETDPLAEAQKRNEELEAKVGELTERLARAELEGVQRGDGDVVPHEAASGESGELVQLTRAVEALEKRLDETLRNQRGAVIDPDPLAATDSPVSGTAILFGLVGVLVGWIGSSYVRRTERTRRTRVRL